ncbi:uncharacterized protein TRIADDRAFT_24046, partial [Trichoplax adhaerens]
VGKSSIVLRYLKRRNPLACNSTIGASFFTNIVHVDNIKFHLQIWDTAGQERFRSMTPLYYRKAQAAIIVYDITDSSTFEATKGWIEELHKNTSDKSLILGIVGNKSDLADQRVVSKEDGLELAHDNSAIYMETSAATGEGKARNLIKK